MTRVGARTRSLQSIRKARASGHRFAWVRSLRSSSCANEEQVLGFMCCRVNTYSVMLL